MPSIRRLLRLSPSLRDLFLAYPEASTQEILRQLPRTIENLLRVSRKLHKVANDDFDPVKSLAVLQDTSIIDDWCSRFPNLLGSMDDPLESLECIIDLYDEVASVTQMYAQRVSAVVEVFVNPHVVTPSMSLSDTEHSRIAASFWILKIFYEFQRRFAFHGRHNVFIPAFMSQLAPWQIEQALAIEWFLQSSCMFGDSPLCVYLDAKYVSGERLMDQSMYVQNYFKITSEIWSQGYSPMEGPVSFNRASRYDRTMPARGPLAWFSLPRFPSPPDTDFSSSPIRAAQLRVAMA